MTESILHQISRGESGAVERCLDAYGALVWSLVRRMMRGSADAEDAVQEIFVEIWKNAAKFDPSKSSEAGFIAMIARRRLIDRIRRRSRRPEFESLASEHVQVEAEGAEAQVELPAEAMLAGKALEQLRPEQQRVLRMAIHDGLTHQEIAAQTGMPLGTVKTHARRGLIKLRELLSTELSPDAGRSLS